MSIMSTSHGFYEGKGKRSLQSGPTLQWEFSNVSQLQLKFSTATWLMLYYFPVLFIHLKP